MTGMIFYNNGYYICKWLLHLQMVITFVNGYYICKWLLHFPPL